MQPGLFGGGTQTPQQQRPAGIPAGRYFGVPVYFSGSWFLFAAFITLQWAGVVRNNVAGLSTGQSYAVAFGFAVLLAISVLAHELGHCVVSLALGLKVRRVVLFLLGGVSEIETEPERPAHEYLVAVAGPLVSLVLAAAGAAVYAALDAQTVVRWLVVELMLSNLLVMLFNLLPGLPLDGGRLLRAAIWQLTHSQLTGTKAAAWGGRGIAVVIVVVALYFQTRDGNSGFFGTLLVVLVAAFIWFNAGQTLRMAQLRAALPQLRVASLARSFTPVPHDVSVGETVRRARSQRSGAVVVLDRDGEPQALVSEAAVLTMPEQRRPWTQVSEVSRPLEPGLVLPDGLAGESLLEALRTDPATEYLVADPAGQAVGVLVTADVAARLKPPGPGQGPPGGANSTPGPRQPFGQQPAGRGGPPGGPGGPGGFAGLSGLGGWRPKPPPGSDDRSPGDLRSLNRSTDRLDGQ